MMIDREGMPKVFTSKLREIDDPKSMTKDSCTLYRFTYTFLLQIIGLVNWINTYLW